jgi:hypothetical protein
VDSTNFFLTVLTGDGKGGFTLAQEPAVADGVVSLVTADFNSDLIPDLVSVSTLHAEFDELLSNGSGSFAAAKHFPINGIPPRAIAGDFNNDAKQDLAVITSMSSIMLLLGDGLGGFGTPTTIPVRWASWDFPWRAPMVVGDA